MSIVILKWNPSFSSYTMARFLNDLERCALQNEGNIGMNWSVWDADKVKKGDTCFLLKVGYGQTGIVARGTITSDPYSGEDWSWRNRPTKYCDFDFKTMINPDAYPILNSTELKNAIPDFDWDGGHSGIVITEKQAEELQRLWEEYIAKHEADFEKASDQNLFILTPDSITDNNPYTFELESYNGKILYIVGTEGEETTKLSIYDYPRLLGKLGVKSFRTLQQTIIRKYPSLGDLKHLCAELFYYQIDFSVDFDKQND